MDNKFRCSLCQKLFKGDEFVKKHIRYLVLIVSAKHSAIVEEEMEDVMFFNRFAFDAYRIGGNDAGANNDRSSGRFGSNGNENRGRDRSGLGGRVGSYENGVPYWERRQPPPGLFYFK